MRWTMKPVKNKFCLDYPLNLQEEFAPFVAFRGSATGVVATEGSVESLPVPVLWRRGRMSEAERQAPCRACRDIEGLFESLLAESFELKF